MGRIAAGLIVAIAVLTMNGVFTRDAFAAEAPTGKVVIERAGDTRETVETRRGSRILALLVALEALRPAS